MGPRERILARIRAEGRISVAEFMREALYGPGGYYRRSVDPVGPKGDFYTSACLHPGFAALLAVQVAQVWEAWGRPAGLDVHEAGGGRGTLATDLKFALRDFSPELARSVVYRVLDWPEARGEGETFERSGPGFPGPVRGIVLANELLDAMPVHRIQRREGQLQELCVVCQGDRLVERPFPLADPRLAAQVAPWAADLPEGAIAEVSLAMRDWIFDLSRQLVRGCAILVDYADEREALWARRKGTLRAYHRHRIVADPFADPGTNDLTCHVDLTGLRQAAADAGLEIQGELSQADFLQNLGLGRIREAIAAAPLAPAAKAANLAALDDLAAPGGLGAFRVVILSRDIRNLALVGLRGGGEPAAAPVLTERHMTLW